jgi:hypothetical protein
LGPNILLSTLFSNTPSLCCSLSVRDQVSHPYKTVALYTLTRSAYGQGKYSLPAFNIVHFRAVNYYAVF